MTTTSSLLLAPLFKIMAIAGAVSLFNDTFSSRNSAPIEVGPEEKWLLRHRAAIATGSQKAFITALGVAESTILLALSFPHLIPTRVVNLLTYGSSSIVPLSANSFHPLSAFVSTSPVSLAPFILGTCLIIGGAILRQWCFKTMGNMFTYEVMLMKEHKLVTSGPYAYVRHPSYTGVAMIYAGLAIWQISPGSWVRASGVLDIAIGKACLGFVLASMAIFTVGSITRMPKEDNLLRARFGRQWDEWAKNVPYRLVPYVY